MPRRVKLASLLAFGLHGFIILSGGTRLGYDAYTHMFFADHYLHHWWSLWDPRWYTGFEVVSYPPLVHQLNALLGSIIGISAGYALLLWIVVTCYPLATYHFSRIFTGKRAAEYAAIGAALLPSLFLSAHTFGQLPTITAGLIALLAAPVLADYLKTGKILCGALAVSMFATLMAAHHATLLFLPFLGGAIFIRLYTQQNAPKRRMIYRLGLYLICAGLAGLIVIWPFWNWGRGQVMQTPIDHASRHNFFADSTAAGMFFLAEYGLLIPLIPVAIRLGFRKRYWGIGLAFLVLFILGLGGTTPLPRLLFGSGWTWLTYDRFSFWASLLLLPFFGAFIVTWKTSFRSFFAIYADALAVTAIIIGFMPSWLPTQPLQLNMRPIVEFLKQGDNSQYRYLTFGFGDQLALLSRLTSATTIDGSYHTARTLDVLRVSGIGQIDAAFWQRGGLAALDQILGAAGGYGVRWGFVELKSYEPIIKAYGWLYVTTLWNGVDVYENPNVVLPPAVKPPAESPFQQFSWGVFPLLSLIVSGGLAIRMYWHDHGLRIFSGIQALAIGLLPFGLTFWYFQTVFAFPHPRLYFTYTDAIFYLSDGLVIIAILAWLSQKRLYIRRLFKPIHPREQLGNPAAWLFCLCLLATLSVFWSLDWRISLYTSLQIWLLFIFFLSLRDTPSALRWFALGSCAAIFVQFAIGVWQFAAQSTIMDQPLSLNWPGNLLPSMSGASVVQGTDGLRWLRAYGTLPHPNLLGGFILALLAGPVALYITSTRLKVIPLFFYGLGIGLMILTFSRSAWLGFAMMFVVLIFRLKVIPIKKILAPILIALMIAVLLLSLYFPLFFTRVTENQAPTEQVSSYTRLWLVQRTLELIRQRPLLGSGIETFSLSLSNHVAQFYKIEPIHDVPFLILSELGPLGLALIAGLVVVFLQGAWKATNQEAVLLSGILAGLLTISIFDHYLWTLPPGRTLLFTMFGLWVGQVKGYERSR